MCGWDSVTIVRAASACTWEGVCVWYLLVGIVPSSIEFAPLAV